MIGLDQTFAQAADESGRGTPTTVEIWTVQSVSGNSVNVVNANTRLSFPYLRSYRIAGSSAPVAGDFVLVLRAGSAGWILGAFGAQPATPTPPPGPVPPPTGPSQSGTTTILPTFTGSFRGGSWRGDTSALFQGDWTSRGINTGAAYYGTQATGIAARASRATLSMRRGSGGVNGAQTPTLVLLGPQGGAPNVLASISSGLGLAVGGNGDAAVPVDWAQQLIDGTAQGIGIYVNASAPYIQIEGQSTDAAGMALRIEWSR
jgi:hypothetical protein